MKSAGLKSLSPQRIQGSKDVGRALAKVLGVERVTPFALAVYAVLPEGLPLGRKVLRAGGDSVRAAKRRVMVIGQDELERWGARARVERPWLLEIAGERGPKDGTERAVVVRRLRDELGARGEGRGVPGGEEAVVQHEEERCMPKIEATTPQPPAEVLSGIEAIWEYVKRWRPCEKRTVREWIVRPHDPLPATRFGSGSRVTAVPGEILAWLKRQGRKQERVARLAG